MPKLLNILSKFSFLFFTLLIICSCGFKLASRNAIPPQLHNIYLQADRPYESFAVKLRKALQSYGINVIENPRPDSVTLHLAETSFTHDEVSSGPSTQARVYNLNYSATFSLVNGKGETILGAKTITATRDLTLAPNEVFEISTQVDATKQSMEQELLTKVFNILSSRQVAQALGAKR